VQRALRADAFADAQQLTQDVTSSALIEGQFSAISYQKGASVIRMLQSWLDDQALDPTTGVPPLAFYTGVSLYLSRNSFGNAKPDALWDALASTSFTPELVAAAQSYETQPGYALLTVSWRDGDAAAAAAGGGVLTVSQSRFFTSPFSRAAASALSTTTDLTTLLYWVPLQLTAPAAALATLPLSSALADSRKEPLFSRNWTYTIGSDSTPFALAGGAWFKLNANATIYTRVNYPPLLWSALGNAAAASAGGAANGLSSSDRASLLDDYMTFAESTGLRSVGINTTAALAFAAALVPLDSSYETNTVFLSHAGTLAALLVPDVPFSRAGDKTADPLADAAARACFVSASSYASAQLATIVAALGWTPAVGETPLTSQLRASVLSAASYFNTPSVVATARALYDAGAASIPADFFQLVMNSVVRWGTPADWAAVKALYLSTTDAAVQRRYLSALTATRDRSLLVDTLAFALTDAVRVGDKVSVITSVASSPWGRDLAWTFAKANWAQLSALYGAGGFDMSALVSSLAGNFQTQAFADDVKQFWKGGADSTISGATHDYSGAQELVGRNILWAAGERADACAFLTAGY
jgi:aminopeptidase N